MPNDETTDAAIATGRQKADEILAGRQEARERRARALAAHPNPLRVRTAIGDGEVAATSRQTSGFLVAAGDSWFDYPFFDVLKLLDDHYGYDVESAAHRGDPIEAMAYQGGQLDKLARCLEKVVAHGAIPKAVLMSGGGDDIAGREFGMLLNNATSDIRGWNVQVVDGVIRQRIFTAYKSMISSINRLCEKDLGKTIPILVHGYDYPVPDGRGYGGGWPFPGPWLEPGFSEKLFRDLEKNKELMVKVINDFNKMLIDLTTSGSPFSNVRFIDLRGTLSTNLANDAYQEWWDNELHPTKKGFGLITDKFAAALSKL